MRPLPEVTHLPGFSGAVHRRTWSVVQARNRTGHARQACRRRNPQARNRRIRHQSVRRMDRNPPPQPPRRLHRVSTGRRAAQRVWVLALSSILPSCTSQRLTDEPSGVSQLQVIVQACRETRQRRMSKMSAGNQPHPPPGQPNEKQLYSLKSSCQEGMRPLWHNSSLSRLHTSQGD